MTGKLFIVAGASGVGKTSLLKQVLAELPFFDVSVSYTTRPPRENERNGRDYHFVSAREFDRMANAGCFLEYAEVFRHRYGTARDEIGGKIAGGLSVVLEIDWQGAQQVKRSLPGAFSIFILPPSITALKIRLQRRRQDSPEDIMYRLSKAREEIRHYGEFDALVVNEDFDVACEALKRLLLNRASSPTELATVEKALQRINENQSIG